MIATREHLDALVGYLTVAGVLEPTDRDSRAWMAGLRAVPRHAFVPTRAWAEPMDDRPEHIIDRHRDSRPWWDAVYSNTTIITQRGDGTADVADTSSPPSSSLSCPHVAMEFLRLLDVADGNRVLEIGTGTGWSAAMLSWRLGDDHVVTVEVDSRVSAAAADALAAAGHCPTVITGDGALGHDARAPYDRVHVTCGVRDIPYAWVQQTRPGGVIVAPWMPAHGQWGEQLQLHVRHGGTAVGRFAGAATFMMMRAQRAPRSWPPYPGEGATSTTRLDPQGLSPAWIEGFGLYLATVAPDLVVTWAGWEAIDGEQAWTMRLRHLHGDDWALVCAWEESGEVEVMQGGGRPLWDELEAAYERWLRAGAPGRERFGMTVGPGGQSVWLDCPDV
jgi:protein-L-isoaspartate(D-aspartate) O-methyltransferase